MQKIKNILILSLAFIFVYIFFIIIGLILQFIFG